MFRAIVEVTKFSRQGWDSYEDVYMSSFYGSTKDEAVAKAKAFISEENGVRHTGDFGITLMSQEAKLVRVETFEVVETY